MLNPPKVTSNKKASPVKVKINMKNTGGTQSMGKK